MIPTNTGGGVVRLLIHCAVALLSLYSVQAFAAPAIGLTGAVAIDGSEQLNGDRGYAVELPVLFEMTDLVSLRLAMGHLRADAASRLTWSNAVDGEDIRFFEDGVALVSQSKFTTGVEVSIPLKLVEPTLSVSVGGGLMKAMEYGETFANPTLAAIEAVEPTASSLALLTEVNLGIRRSLSPHVALFVQTGYSVATVSETNISTSNPALNLRRESIGLNTAHLGLGVMLTP